MKTPDNILIIRPDRLGDLILSLPVAETLKAGKPGCKITYLVSSYTSAIAPMAHYVDEWLVDGNERIRLSLLKLSRLIKEKRFDCIIELKPSWRTAMAGFLSGTKLRIGTSRRFYSFFYSTRLSIHRKGSGFHQTELELKHIETFDIPNKIKYPGLSVTKKGLERANGLLSGLDKKFIVIHPGSGGSAPNWPLEHYQTLARSIMSQLEYETVITNGEPINGFENCINISGKTDIETLAGILSKSSLFISGSTGPLHLADSLGVTCMAFYTSKPHLGPDRWGPVRNLDNVLIPESECHCSDLGECKCLAGITPEQALKKATGLLAAKRGSEVGR